MAEMLSLYGKKIAFAGAYTEVPRRQINKRVKALDASIHRNPRTMAASMDIVVESDHFDRFITEAAVKRGATVYTERRFLAAIGWFYDQDSRLSELRGLLHGKKDPDSWRAVCQVLELWREGVEVGIQYVEANARDWPVEVKVAPGKWLARQYSGHPEPRLAVCTAITNAPGLNHGLTFRQQVLAMPHVRHIKLGADSRLDNNIEFLRDKSLEVESLLLFYPRRADPAWGFVAPFVQAHKRWVHIALPHLHTLYIQVHLHPGVRTQLEGEAGSRKLQYIFDIEDIPAHVRVDASRCWLFPDRPWPKPASAE